MKKNKNIMQYIKDISFIIFCLTASFSAGGVVFMQVNIANDVKEFKKEFGILVVHLKIKKLIPENLCFKSDDPFFLSELQTYDLVATRKEEEEDEGEKRMANYPETAFDQKKYREVE